MNDPHVRADLFVKIGVVTAIKSFKRGNAADAVRGTKQVRDFRIVLHPGLHVEIIHTFHVIGDACLGGIVGCRKPQRKPIQRIGQILKGPCALAGISVSSVPIVTAEGDASILLEDKERPILQADIVCLRGRVRQEPPLAGEVFQKLRVVGAGVWKSPLRGKAQHKKQQRDRSMARFFYCHIASSLGH